MLTRRRKSPILVPRFSFSLSHKDTGKQKERNGERKKDEAKRPKKRNIQRKVDKKKEAIIKATGVLLMPELLHRLEEGALEKLSLILSEVRPPPGPPSLQCWAGGCAASALINPSHPKPDVVRSQH